MRRLFDKPRVGRRREARVQRLRHIDDESLGRAAAAGTNDFHPGPPLDRLRPQTGFLGRNRGGSVLKRRGCLARSRHDRLRRGRVIFYSGRSLVKRRAWRPD